MGICKRNFFCAFAGVLILFSHTVYSQFAISKRQLADLDAEIRKIMRDGNIPGASVVILKQGQKIIRSYGVANKVTGARVTSTTLFELGSCSKAFTALAITRLEQEGKIDLDADVCQYIPWFDLRHKSISVPVTVRQLLYHTSGIPWKTISKIPASDEPDALTQTVRQLIGLEIEELPGKRYEYATINYDVLALIIERVTHSPFEVYLQSNVINTLQLSATTVGIPSDQMQMAQGHKIGFWSARPYEAPEFRGNYAAGYVISNAEDIGRWMQIQLGQIQSELSPLIQLTHQRDETVPLHYMSAYARGWNISLDGSGEIYHEGLNPNFTAYIVLRPKENLAVAVLANSNSNFTSFMGSKLMKMVAQEEIRRELIPGDENDSVYSCIAVALSLYIVFVMALIVMRIVEAQKLRLIFQFPSAPVIRKFIVSIVFVVPFLAGLYLLPEGIAGFTWESMLVWMPASFEVLIVILIIAITLSYLAYFIFLCLPEEKRFQRKLPFILLMSILSGVGNVTLIIMVSSAGDTEMELPYVVFYFILVMTIYLLGRRFVQVSLIHLTRGLVYDLRIQLTTKIFSTSFEKFEKIDRGRVYTALNDDVNTIGQSASMFVTLITSVITTAAAFIFLATIAFWAAVLTIGLIATLSTVYYCASRSTNVYFERARDQRNVFMRLISGMVDGFKELSLHRAKKLAYKDAVAASANEFREKISTADIRFVNAFLIGESLLVVMLGVVAFGIPEIFPNIRYQTVLSFVIVLLYLIGPINSILGAVPSVVHLRVAWNRIQGFLREIPANLDLSKTESSFSDDIFAFEAHEVTFQYDKVGKDDSCFRVGPINLKASPGEIIFIVGGNGSGKTTLAKLLTGLYTPKDGYLSVNGRRLASGEAGGFFSASFSPPYLFEYLYAVSTDDKKDEIDHYLNLLDLRDKVSIANNKYSSIDLSNGQRKRLALLQCYLEDSPIYLFDEWAADQDPEYRKFFYCTLLPQMRVNRKIVVAITHDDHYFHIADKVFRMYQGKLQPYLNDVGFKKHDVQLQ